MDIEEKHKYVRMQPDLAYVMKRIMQENTCYCFGGEVFASNIIQMCNSFGSKAILILIAPLVLPGCKSSNNRAPPEKK